MKIDIGNWSEAPSVLSIYFVVWTLNKLQLHTMNLTTFVVSFQVTIRPNIMYLANVWLITVQTCLKRSYLVQNGLKGVKIVQICFISGHYSANDVHRFDIWSPFDWRPRGCDLFAQYQEGCWGSTRYVPWPLIILLRFCCR